MTPQPDPRGHFGPYGGRFVPEVLMAPIEELEQAYVAAREDPEFQAELRDLLSNYAGRPTPLYFAQRLTESLGGARIYLKREDLLHTGAHKINNCLGQALLARRMGKRRIIAETGAGQHGVATATVCALMGFDCVVYMGEEDMRRQRLNVFRMRMLGAKVVRVATGSRTLKDAISEAMRDWVTNVGNTHYLLGSVLGAHPYPMMVRDFQKVIGEEARRQTLEAEARLPDSIFACVGGGSNAIGIFHAFLADTTVRLIGIEAGGRGDAIGEQVEAQHGNADRHPREHAHPPRQLEELLAAVQHLAPARHRRVGQAKKAQAGLDQDRRAGVEGNLNDHRRQGIGQDFPEDQVAGRQARRPRRQDELALRQGDELAIDEPCLDRPDRERDGGDLQPEARPQQRHAEQHDDDGRQGMEKIGDAQQDRCKRPAEVAGQRADRAADQERHRRRAEADGER